MPWITVLRLKPSWCLQAARAEAALTLARAQHVRQLQQLQETAGGDCREQLEALQARLQEEQRRSRQLEEALRHQAQQGSSQISMKQVDATSYMLTTGSWPQIMLNISMLVDPFQEVT